MEVRGLYAHVGGVRAWRHRRMNNSVRERGGCGAVRRDALWLWWRWWVVAVASVTRERERERERGNSGEGEPAHSMMRLAYCGLR